MKRLQWPRLGRLREASILLPTAVLLLVSLSTFIVFSARHSLELLAESRRAEAAVLARRLAQLLSTEERLPEIILSQNALLARRAAVIDEDGRVQAAKGEFESAFLLAPIEDVTDLDSLALGPNPMLPGVVAGFARFVRRGEALTVRVDLSAAEIVAQQRAVTTLTWVVVPVNGLIMIFVLVYLARSLKPYEQLLSQARRIEPTTADPREDEIDYLLKTFESAMNALAREDHEDPEDEIASLQRALAPSLESGVLLLDPEGIVLALNPFGASILGITEVPKGEPIDRVLGHQAAFSAKLIQTLESREGIKREEVTIEIDHSRRILGLTVHPLRHREGSIRGYLVLFVDLTEIQRQAEEDRISRTLDQLAELAAGIAHELRNGIATLLGYLTLIERQPSGETVASYLEEIRHEGERMERVLKDFLTFATPGSLRPERVAVVELIRRAVSDPILAECALKLDLSRGEGVVVEVDPDLVEQGIRNLLRNALEAQTDSRPPVIEVELLRDDEHLEVAITDQGPGIPPAVRDHLFQPFVSGRHDGVGLGLSLTHRIATLHGGGLRFEDPPTGGARAVFTLPTDTIVTK